jgi:uncharacterized protein
MRLMLGIGCVVGLAACSSSPPLHYYTLSEVAGSGQPSAAAGTTALRLDRVTVPTELDRDQLVRRIDATRLQVLDGDRWAAPLEDSIRRVLSNDLAARLPPGLVVDPNDPSTGEKRQSLSVDIQDYYGDAACAVTLRAAWVLKPADGPASRGNEDIKIPGGADCAGPATLPPAMSQALGQLSDRIAAAVAHH